MGAFSGSSGIADKHEKADDEEGKRNVVAGNYPILSRLFAARKCAYIDGKDYRHRYKITTFFVIEHDEDFDCCAEN